MKKRKKLVTFWIVLTVLFAAVFICGTAFGSVNLSLPRILGAFCGTDKTAAVIVFDLRLPRVLAAGLAGIGLALAGYLLQTVTDNELCAPNIIGVNSGAGFAVMLISCFAPMLWRAVPFAAFLGALITTLLVISVSYFGKKYEHKSSIVLAGVAVSSMLSAGISTLSLKFPDVLSSYTAFSVGGFSGVTVNDILIPAIMIFICFILAVIIAPKVSLLCLGDDVAATLGINVRAMRFIAIAIASALCAAVVSFAGLLGFVGLIVPNMVRRILKSGLRTSLPFAGIFGAVLVMLSDLIGRTLFSPTELPAGIIMSFIGAPFFLWLLLKRRKS